MRRTLALALALIALAGCQTPKPDYTIRVMPTPDGMVAIPPTCPNWGEDTVSFYDNQILPQYGCAHARNLALTVERPEDLVKGRDFGDARGVTTVGAMRRYDNNQTRGLIDLGTSPDMSVAVTTAPTATSPMTGDVTGGSGGSSSSSSSSAASP